MPPSKWHEANRDYAHNCTPAACSLKPVATSPADCRSSPEATLTVAASGGNRCDRADRCGQVDPNPVCLHRSPEAAYTYTPSTRVASDAAEPTG
jgi:hypothetical protein